VDLELKIDPNLNGEEDEDSNFAQLERKGERWKLPESSPAARI
jgi:hypothetical protein